MAVRFSSGNTTSYIDAGNMSLPSGDWAIFFGIDVGAISGATERMCFASLGAASDTILGANNHIAFCLQNTSGGNAFDLNQLMVTGRDSAGLNIGNRPVANFMQLTTERNVLSGFGMPSAGRGFVCLQKSGTEIQLWQVRAPGETAVLVSKTIAMGAWAGVTAQPLLLGCLNRASRYAFTQISTAMQRFGRVAKALTQAQMERIASGADPVALLSMNAPDGDLYWSFDGLTAVTAGQTFTDAVQGQVATASGSSFITTTTEPIPTAETTIDTRLLRKEIYDTATGAVIVDGTYRTTGTVTDVQVRVLNNGSSAVIVDWTTVASNVSGGTWSGSLAGLSRAVLDLQFQVRLVIDGVTQAAVTGFVAQAGLGVVFAGQSLAEYIRTDSAISSGPSANIRTFVASTVPPNTSGGGSYTSAAQARFRRGSSVAYNFQIGYGEATFGSILATAASCRVMIGNAAQAGAPIENFTNNVFLCFDRLVETLNRTRASILYWEQGQSNQATSGADYKALLTTLLTNLRAQVSHTFVFAISPLALSLDANSSAGALYGLRVAQKEWVVERNAAGDANVILADNGTNDITLSDNIHQAGTAAGAGRMMERFAQTVLKQIGVATHSGEGPELTGITWDGATSIAVAVAQNGGTGLQTPSVGSITGFEVSADGGSTWVAPSAAAITNATTITLTLSGTPAQSPLVRYQFGGPGPTPSGGQSTATRRTNAGIDNPVYDNRSPLVNASLGYSVGFTTGNLAVASDFAAQEFNSIFGPVGGVRAGSLGIRHGGSTVNLLG